ncbi:ComF family protein [Vibrio rotiferianus]|uniref:ComF family protein n=1 Tax=Vibrio rotiferianus TaxID=190895 RepID=UPI00406AA9CF
MLSHHWQNIMFHLLGSQCALCQFPLDNGQSSILRWCSSCTKLLQPQSRCLRCGLQLSPTDSERELVCGTCLADPPPWQKLYTLGDYGFPLAGEIQRFKDRRELWQVPGLCQQLADQISDPAPLLTSVPIHWKRYLTRGFNQSAILTRYLAQNLSQAHDTQLFSKVRYTRSQRHYRKQLRAENLAHAFKLNRIPEQNHIAIVDDVVTTGSTVRQLCQLLLEVGVERIDIYCICRTPVPNTI